MFSIIKYSRIAQSGQSVRLISERSWVRNPIWLDFDNLPEWLMGRPAKPLDFIRAGSNPAVVVGI